MTYKAVKNPYYSLKDGLSGLPKRVSFYGAPPVPANAYEIKHQPSVEMTDARGHVTYSNYFFGEVLQNFAQAESVAAKLNNQG